MTTVGTGSRAGIAHLRSPSCIAPALARCVTRRQTRVLFEDSRFVGARRRRSSSKRQLAMTRVLGSISDWSSWVGCRIGRGEDQSSTTNGCSQEEKARLSGGPYRGSFQWIRQGNASSWKAAAWAHLLAW